MPCRWQNRRSSASSASSSSSRRPVSEDTNSRPCCPKSCRQVASLSLYCLDVALAPRVDLQKSCSLPQHCCRCPVACPNSGLCSFHAEHSVRRVLPWVCSEPGMAHQQDAQLPGRVAAVAAVRGGDDPHRRGIVAGRPRLRAYLRSRSGADHLNERFGPYVRSRLDSRCCLGCTASGKRRMTQHEYVMCYRVRAAASSANRERDCQTGGCRGHAP